MSHTRLASELAIRGGRAAALQNMNLHDSRDKRAVVLQKVVIQKLHDGLHQGNRSFEEQLILHQKFQSFS